eukprot:6444824-Alexandrium_andersonii.AAC.1
MRTLAPNVLAQRPPLSERTRLRTREGPRAARGCPREPTVAHGRSRERELVEDTPEEPTGRSRSRRRRG